MNLSLPEDSLMVRDMFQRFFEGESTSERIREAEPLGFDPALWRELVALDAPCIRLSEAAGGSGMGLFDACLMMEQAGRRLASAPLAESVAAMRLVGEVGGSAAAEWIGRIADGESILVLALHKAEAGVRQLVPGGAVAKGIVTFDGSELAIEEPAAPLSSPDSLASNALGVFLPGCGSRTVIAEGDAAFRAWSAAVEEWKLLTASALVGLAQESLAMASAYASERQAFGSFIGAYQGIGHPLADDVIDADGARLLLWWTLRRIADGREDAGACISQLYWWANRTATNAVAHAIHTYGGYGLSNEYDIQLYHRRAKAWGLALGDPADECARAGRRQVLGEQTVLPDVGVVEINFDPPEGGEALAAETRALFDSIIDPQKHLLHDHSFESHDWEVHRALGEAGLLFPSWPEEWGGRGADADSARASRAVWRDVGYTPPAAGVTGMIGEAVMHFGSQELKEEVLLRFARGEVTACLGYTEPSCGSDVFAAKTRAVRDGDDWVINGQKMFTSGANLASYVFLLTRTDPDVPKHRGLTMFLVPLDDPGVEIHPVYTFMDERTNATFYSDVRIPDRYRVGEVNGGVKVMSSALSQEQSGGGYYRNMREMAAAVEAWAQGRERNGRPLLEDPGTQARLAEAYTRSNIAETMEARVLATWLAGETDLAFGPASKIFVTESFITVSTDLIDLAAPDSLLRGKEGLGLVEMGYRHSSATTVYGGSSEVLRSMVAERRLGLPRSRG
ncbi:acyl-CoA dehydrogenase [Haliea sp. E17]|uniref:acyl-CoA dehydrogenase n=1 Tax=Haliea sp. E17 TaxID=3401576 RepID=UPI003AAE7642